MSASSKRRATSDLNHDNWDRESEPETMGTFQTAPEGELKNRVIRKAVRKLATVDSTNKSDDADGGTKSVFSGFSGFGKTTSTATTVSPFSSISSNDTSKKTEETKSSSTTFSFLNKFASSTPSTTDAEPKAEVQKTNSTPQGETAKTAANTPANIDKFSFEKSTNYYAKLKGLNQAVSAWIKTHVDQNPLCLLTPIFRDYEKYLDEIKKSEGSPAEGASQSQAMNNFKFQSSATTFSFGNKKTDETDSAPEPKKTSIFGNSTKSPDDKPTNSTTGFTFGGTKTETPAASIFSAPSTGFSFGGSKPFSFGNVQPPPPSTDKAAGNTDDKENGDEEDEPPKVEFKAVVEEDSVYSKRCKVFVKNDGNFTDRGVGTVFLKPVKDSTKTQLLVRADTNLGNILVNLILNDSIPTQRMGKNNVMLVCVPTPDVEKPTPMLLRVKTSEEADELLETIDKYKKK